MNLETKITIYKFTPQLFTLTPNALPIPPKRNSGFEYCRKTFGGAYSSGSVQDLHLIPFSPLFP